MNTEQASRNFLKKIGMPIGDAFQLPLSEKRFPDGSQYRIEVFGIQNPVEMKLLLEEIHEEKLVVHRLIQTDGIMNLTNDELSEMVRLSKAYQVQLLLAVGPRSATDISPSAHSQKGGTMGNRLRGQEQIIRAMEDVKRGIELGARGFLVYDEGNLWVLAKMRAMGEIPKDCHFKFSANSGYGNPCSIKLIEELGADSINPVWDLELAMLAAIRQAIAIPMDVHMVAPKSVGGFIRYYEAPQMIRVASPVYLKLGATEDSGISIEQKIKSKIKQMRLVKEMIDKYYPEAIQSNPGTID